MNNSAGISISPICFCGDTKQRRAVFAARHQTIGVRGAFEHGLGIPERFSADKLKDGFSSYKRWQCEPTHTTLSTLEADASQPAGLRKPKG